MSLKDKLKPVANWTAAVSAAVAMNSGDLQAVEPDNVHRNAPLEQITRPTTEYLDYRVERGTLINGETIDERQGKFAAVKKEKGVMAAYNAIQQEEIKKIEIPNKDKEGYLFETYEPGKDHRFESYYPNGVLQSKMGQKGEEATGYYPDGSKKFDRTAEGVETHYHPGGKKGYEKIKETPHGIYDPYDVLDGEGRRIEHHYDVQESNHVINGDNMVMRDVKKVDLYNPETKKVEATYTLDDWNVEQGRVAEIGYVDEKGKMQTITFSKATKIGDSVYYAHSLSTDMIKKMVQEKQAERNAAAIAREGLKRRQASH